jgi:hypothetical protein
LGKPPGSIAVRLGLYAGAICAQKAPKANSVAILQHFVNYCFLEIFGYILKIAESIWT